jgi:hypothetical protein
VNVRDRVADEEQPLTLRLGEDAEMARRVAGRVDGAYARRDLLARLDGQST